MLKYVLSPDFGITRSTMGIYLAVSLKTRLSGAQAAVSAIVMEHLQMQRVFQLLAVGALNLEKLLQEVFQTGWNG